MSLLAGLSFHHVGVGVTDLDAAVRVYESLGYVLQARVEDAELGVKAAFLGGQGPWIELVAALTEGEGPLKGLLSRGLLPAPYHTCYAVEDLTQASRALVARGFVALGKPKPAVAFGGAPILYHAHRAIGLIELVERPPF
jgi:methylmalonyl-CoA/ethylmalonyl-CoA epimerase